MAATYAIETRKPDFDSTWRRCPNTPVGPRSVIDDHMAFLRDRAAGSEYRAVELNAEAPESDDINDDALACSRLAKSNWINTIYLVPKGNDHYLDRFADTYPVVGAALSDVIRQAGTEDADAKVLLAAGSIIADRENWIARAAAAMHRRDGKKFDSLVTEAYHIMLKAAQL